MLHTFRLSSNENKKKKNELKKRLNHEHRETSKLSVYTIYLVTFASNKIKKKKAAAH